MKKGLSKQQYLPVSLYLMLSFLLLMSLYQMTQFPTVSHPQTLERRYLGIINGLMLDLMKVSLVH